MYRLLSSSDPWELNCYLALGLTGQMPQLLPIQQQVGRQQKLHMDSCNKCRFSSPIPICESESALQKESYKICLQRFRSWLQTVKSKLQVLESLETALAPFFSHDKEQKIAHPEKCLTLEIIDHGGSLAPMKLRGNENVELIPFYLRFCKLEMPCSIRHIPGIWTGYLHTGCHSQLVHRSWKPWCYPPLVILPPLTTL